MPLPAGLPLLAVAVPWVLAAGVTWLAVTQPSLLRGVPRDLTFIVRLIRATHQLNKRLKASRGTMKPFSGVPAKPAETATPPAETATPPAVKAAPEKAAPEKAAEA